MFGTDRRSKVGLAMALAAACAFVAVLVVDQEVARRQSGDLEAARAALLQAEEGRQKAEAELAQAQSAAAAGQHALLNLAARVWVAACVPQDPAAWFEAVGVWHAWAQEAGAQARNVERLSCPDAKKGRS